MEVTPDPMTVQEDVVVCDSLGQAQTLVAGSVVRIFAHNPLTRKSLHALIFVSILTLIHSCLVSDGRRTPVRHRCPQACQDVQDECFGGSCSCSADGWCYGWTE